MEMEIQMTNESRGGASLHDGARLPPVHFPDRAAGSPPAELPRPDRSSSCSSPISSSTSRCNPYGAPAVPCRTDPPWPTAVVLRLRSAIIDEEKNYKSALPKWTLPHDHEGTTPQSARFIRITRETCQSPKSASVHT
jgi:hypothetical protein